MGVTGIPGGPATEREAPWGVRQAIGNLTPVMLVYEPLLSSNNQPAAFLERPRQDSQYTPRHGNRRLATTGKEITMQKAQGAKLGLLALLKVSDTLKGQGEVQVMGRPGLLSRMTSWTRRR